MKGQPALLFNHSIVGSSFTVKARMVLTNAQNMFYKHLNCEMKKSCPCHWVAGYQTVAFIICVQIRTECFFGIGIIQAHWMFDIHG